MQNHFSFCKRLLVPLYTLLSPVRCNCFRRNEEQFSIVFKQLSKPPVFKISIVAHPHEAI